MLLFSNIKLEKGYEHDSRMKNSMHDNVAEINIG